MDVWQWLTKERGTKKHFTILKNCKLQQTFFSTSFQSEFVDNYRGKGRVKDKKTVSEVVVDGNHRQSDRESSTLH